MSSPSMADARRLAFSIIATGLGTTPMIQALLLINILVPLKKSLNLAVHEISDAVVRESDLSCRNAIPNLPAECTISFDGSWEHRRGSHRCLFDVFCQETRQMMDFAMCRRFEKMEESLVEADKIGSRKQFLARKPTEEGSEGSQNRQL
jgi:hypothetical protein